MWIEPGLWVPDRNHNLRCPRELASSKQRQLGLQPVGLDLSALMISPPNWMRETGVQTGAAPEPSVRLSFPGQSPLSWNPIFLAPARPRASCCPSSGNTGTDSRG